MDPTEISKIKVMASMATSAHGIRIWSVATGICESI
jgi:hypothetical protein